MRIVFAGTPPFAVPALQALAGSAHQVLGILTQPDRPKGRGRKLAASAVKEAALALGLPVDQPQSLKSEEGRARLRQWQPDLLVVVAYGLILPCEVLELPRLGCLNIHASLLPRWRGAAPIQRAILAGDAETGIAIMQMDAGLDTGPVLLSRRTPIGAAETSAALHERLAALGAQALMEALPALESGRAHPQPQDAHGVTYAAKIDKAEARIDWGLPALQIERQVRAFNPWPVAETCFAGEPLKILEARADMAGGDVHEAQGAAIGSPVNQPGRIERLNGEALYVRCGDGLLRLDRVQRPGRRPVSARAFAAAADVLGAVLG